MQHIRTTLLLVLLTSIGLANTAQAAMTSTYSFSQSGFSSGGTVSGFFRGTDLDGDGQLYAMSRFISDGIPGVEFGNELEYAEVTFDGFFAAPLTLVYDKSVADMEAFENAFQAFSYNLDGGSFGDDPDEGWSFSFFAPSINYQLGQAFSYFWDPIPLPDPTFGTCGSGAVCGGVVEYIPDAGSPGGVVPGYTDFSTAIVEVTPVPVPAAFWFMLSGLGALAAAARRKRAA